jgi:hypothetical protein
MKAVEQVDYVAMLLRIQFLESIARKDWLTENPPTRILLPSRRLPMMHREGWPGPKAANNMCHAWFIWDKRRSQNLTKLDYYDWKDFGNPD